MISSLSLSKILRLEIMKMYYDIKQSGERIRQLRIQSRNTQEALAKKLNIDRSLLSHIEAGKRGCSVDLLIQLSNFFGVSLDVLVLGKEQDMPLSVKERQGLKSEIAALISRMAALQEKL